ncbi:MAG: tetratricopeptide repeat protein [Planctomycetaceae bacterium]
MKPRAKRRLWLYGAGVALGAALLFAGFGITVPPDPGTRLAGASLLAQMGDTTRALQLCDQTIREHPKCAEAYLYRASILAMAGRNVEALEAYDRTLALLTDETIVRDVVSDRASVLLALGREGEFRAQREWLASTAVDYRVHLLDGLAAQSAGDWAGAAGAYRRAMEAAPDEARIAVRLWEAEMGRGEAAFGAARWDEAKAAFDAARAAVPAEPRAHLRAAEARLALRDSMGAIEVLRDVARSTPGIAALVFRAATMEMEGGRGTRAFWALQAALQADPEGTRVLLAAEPSWRRCGGDPRVLEALSQEETPAEEGLTGRQ